MPRFFLENMDREPGESLCVTGQDAQHISKSLRMKAGEKLTVCGGLGYDLLCELTGVFDDRVELTVTEKIWGILLDVLRAIAEAFNFDQDEMMRAIINNNNKELNAVRRAFEALQLAA